MYAIRLTSSQVYTDNSTVLHPPSQTAHSETPTTQIVRPIPLPMFDEFCSETENCRKSITNFRSVFSSQQQHKKSSSPPTSNDFL